MPQPDAEYSARLLGWVDPLSVKHEVHDEQAVERTHPSYYSLAEQWEHYVQAIQTLRVGEAYRRQPRWPGLLTAPSRPHAAQSARHDARI